jgi:hypothetical protein
MSIGSLWVAFCCLLGFPCFAYFFTYFQDVLHKCGYCHQPLAIVYKKDGRVELLVEVPGAPLP